MSGSTIVLYRNDSDDVWVIDIPASIAEAQAFGNDRLKLISCPALEKPWPHNEPKSDKARDILKSQQPDDRGLQKAISDALAIVRASHSGAYCLSRVAQAASAATGEKRRRSEITPDRAAEAWPGHDRFRPFKDGYDLSEEVGESLHVIAPPTTNLYVKSQAEVEGKMVHNASPSIANLRIQDKSIMCRIPPFSSFFLGDCSASMPFHRAVRQLAQRQQTKSQFDVVVMDPPWPSASVRRGAQKGQAHYNVKRSLWDMRQLLFDMDLGPLISADGLLAVWITNKPTINDMILSQQDGLFESCGLQLVEEWIWVKVTSSGEPILPVDGLWRKPYEILLIGRKKATAKGRDLDGRHTASPRHNVKRRVIFAVPDLHSRKPCLKQPLKRILGISTDHRGLEIFARNLISGWHAWGNEVLKFTEEMCWTRDCAP
ncbi:MT-A70-domain-containing protein [Myriangium duriaei CBS 260.36]|uniref:MT-A70-domain-containing protein n=1 Tax=Myriangium duriaei CBS 260.36 TaxID=1168546 RepID=A0A9P4MFK7_9PEZI|nr:MT-A70-domain-containing protein [Myriangium duriaei CBS 260.36]